MDPIVRVSSRRNELAHAAHVNAQIMRTQPSTRTELLHTVVCPTPSFDVSHLVDEAQRRASASNAKVPKSGA